LWKTQYYEHNKRHGKYQEFSPNGKLVIEQEFENGLENGSRTEWWHATDIKKRVCPFRDGLKHGVEKGWTIDGKLIFYKKYNNGIPTGRCITRFIDNGNLERKCFYTHSGMLDGYYIEYQYLNERTCVSKKDDEESEKDEKSRTRTTLYKKCYYDDGQMVGKYEEYHDNGTISKIAEYDDQGELDGEYFEFNRFGRCIVRYQYSRGKLEGVCERYTDEGKLQEHGYYHLGELDGWYRQYYDNKKPKMEQFFKQGILHGPVVYYRRNGKVLSRYVYNNGVCQEFQNFQ
jgi:antitoxin component YwqK of YwqJK toxin-antitoxin module